LDAPVLSERVQKHLKVSKKSLRNFSLDNNFRRAISILNGRRHQVINEWLENFDTPFLMFNGNSDIAYQRRKSNPKALWRFVKVSY
jgi:hypothetical protein